MNCNAIRKFIYAFADGQLDVKVNCEVLDHLKMCPACSRLVDEHQALRATIGRTIQRVHSPATGLRDRVVEALGQAEPAAARKRLKLVRPLAAAAVIAVLAGGVWWSTQSLGGGQDPAFAPVTVRQGSSAASKIADVHQSCCSHASTHQSKDLPTSLSEVAPALCAHYQGSLAALAPSLAAYGFDFESANFCGVRNKPGCSGGHVIYVSNDQSRRVSFFSIPRWDCLDKCGQRGIPNTEGFRQYEVHQDDGGRLCILAWHNDATTYICCGPLALDRLKEMVHDVRSAMIDFDDQVRLASLGGPGR